MCINESQTRALHQIKLRLNVDGRMGDDIRNIAPHDRPITTEQGRGMSARHLNPALREAIQEFCPGRGEGSGRR